MPDPAVDASLFPQPLRRDPAVALNESAIRIPKRVTGPVHGVQLVIEIAGPRSVSAGQAHELLGPRWNAALGVPEVYVMASSDNEWRLMSTSDGSGSYDSIALAWDMLGVSGALSTASARQLLQTSESFANGVGRRAFPFPSPDEIDRAVLALKQARESLDVGVEIFVQGPRAIPEREIWVACAALGLDLSPEGTFVWRIPDWDEPLITAAPVEEGVAYSLSAVQRGADHEAISLGFNVPQSPDPGACLESLFHAADAVARRLSVVAYDDEGRPLDQRQRKQLAENLRAAVQALTSSELAPGSAQALKLFGT